MVEVKFEINFLNADLNIQSWSFTFVLNGRDVDGLGRTKEKKLQDLDVRCSTGQTTDMSSNILVTVGRLQPISKPEYLSQK